MLTVDPARPLVIASDHGGLQLKQHLCARLREWGIPVLDLGTQESGSVDYPDYAVAVAEALLGDRASAGILICGTGIGMSIAANRIPGIRAALCTSGYTARMARAHNHANVLCLGERVTGPGEAEDILRAFLEQDEEGGRHSQRLAKLESSAAALLPRGQKRP